MDWPCHVYGFVLQEPFAAIAVENSVTVSRSCSHLPLRGCQVVDLARTTGVLPMLNRRRKMIHEVRHHESKLRTTVAVKRL